MNSWHIRRVSGGGRRCQEGLEYKMYEALERLSVGEEEWPGHLEVSWWQTHKSKRHNEIFLVDLRKMVVSEMRLGVFVESHTHSGALYSPQIIRIKGLRRHDFHQSVQFHAWFSNDRRYLCSVWVLTFIPNEKVGPLRTPEITPNIRPLFASDLFCL